MSEYWVLSSIHGVSLHRIIDDQNVWCAKGPISFLYLLLSDTLRQPRIESTMMLWVIHLSSQKMFHIFRSKIASAWLVSKSSITFFSNISLGSDIQFSKDGTEIQLTMFSIIVRMTCLSKSSDWSSLVTFLGDRSRRLLKTLKKCISAMSYRQYMVALQAACLGPLGQNRVLGSFY